MRSANGAATGVRGRGLAGGGWWAWAALALAGAFVLGATSVRFALPRSTVSLWWPAAGLAVAFLLATHPGRRRSLGFVVGVVASSAAANWLEGRPAPVSLLYGFANAAEVAVVVAILTAGGRRPRLASLEDLWRLLAATVAGALVVGVLAGLTASVLLDGAFVVSASAVAASHGAAVLVMAPLGIAARTRRARRPRWDDVVQWVVVAVVTLWVFLGGQSLPLAFPPIPFLVWGALRQPLRAVSAQLLALAVVTVTLTSSGRGPFATAAAVYGMRPEAVGALTQAFVVTAAVTTLALSVTASQRRQALDELRSEGELTKVVLDTAASAIVVVDAEGVIVRLNATAARLLGAPEEQLRGRLAAEVFPVDDPRELARRMGRIREGGVPLHDEQDWHVAGLGVRHIVWTNAYLTDPDGSRTHLVKTGVDVTDERAARTFVEAVLESATATAIVGTDLAGVITLFNRGAENLLGWSSAEVVGRRDWSLLHDPAEIGRRAQELGVEPGLEVLVRQVRAAGSAEAADWTYVRKDGTRRTVSVAVSGIRDAAGRPSGYLMVAEDVTGRREAEVALQAGLDRERQAVEELTRLDRTKSDFVSTVSHELRTPLASVLGYAEMLEDGAAGDLTPRQLELVERVDRNGRRLLALIEDLLINSRIETGRLDLQPTRCDLADVVASAWASVETVTRDRTLVRELDVSPAPLWVEGDAAALERMVTNLLSNAVKFTPDGGWVSLVARPDERHSDTVRLVVSDTGIGIPAADHERVFARFFRSAAANERAIQGPGLGLSIVRAIAEGHGGSVSVESAPDEGATFTVSIPRVGLCDKAPAPDIFNIS
ncbi:PAS domain S-box protein [Terrabacter sp. NPDC080008]|uniref:sensor histidine kinase n=1 Tax=Terrabacter sp. NPDC080008 TaxID=3155176 RepID=UPI0034510A04